MQAFGSKNENFYDIARYFNNYQNFVKKICGDYADYLTI